MILPPPCCLHDRVGGLTAHQGSGQVGVEHGVPLRDGVVLRRLADRHAGVVDQDVEAAEALDGTPHHLAARFRIGDVERNEGARRSRGLQPRHRRLGFLAVAGRDDDGGARFRQALGHAEPDAAIAAGDDCDAPGKIERLHDNSPPVRLPRALREILRQSPRFGNRRRSGREELKPLRRVVQRRAVSGFSTTIPDNAGCCARPDRDGVGHDRADRRDG